MFKKKRFTTHESSTQPDYAIVIDNVTGEEVFSGTVKECKDYCKRMNQYTAIPD